MKYLFLGLVIAALLVFGCTGEQAPKISGAPTAPPGNAKPQVAAPRPPAPPAQEPQTDQGKIFGQDVKTKARSGYVNESEIGGEGLVVVSVWKPNATVMPDGSFTTEVSTTGAQLVMLLDKDKKARATAISLPEDASPLVFDAKSATKASMWIGGSANQSVAEEAMAFMETMDCYPSLYSYMKANLKQKSLSEISNFSNKEYMDIQMNCSSQILAMVKKNMQN